MVPGSELTKEPFRWDQRIFSLVMRLPASVPPDVAAFPYIPSAENTAIDVMCEVTGGKIWKHFKTSLIILHFCEKSLSLRRVVNEQSHC